MSALVLQAGAASLEASRDPKLGLIACRVKCWSPDLVTALEGTVPDIGIKLVENQPRNVSRSEAGDDGGYDVLVVLEGLINPGSEGEEFGLEGSTSNDEIESHPHYEALLELYKGREDPSTGRALWPRTLDDETGGKHRNPMHGVTDYLVPGLVWTRKWVARTLPGSIVRTLGTFEQPPGNPPEVTGGRQWIKIRARASFRGNVWCIEESWLLSGPYAIAPELYRG